jgi:hypothetical protein
MFQTTPGFVLRCPLYGVWWFYFIPDAGNFVHGSTPICAVVSGIKTEGYVVEKIMVIYRPFDFLLTEV